MDSLMLLTADHNRVRGLFTRFRDAQEKDDVDAMRALAEQIITELEVHTRIEEEIFYPEVRQGSGELDETVAEGIEEHHVVDVLIDEVRQLTPGDEAWVAKMTVMMENVEHHASEEEDEMFPDVRRARRGRPGRPGPAARGPQGRAGCAHGRRQGAPHGRRAGRAGARPGDPGPVDHGPRRTAGHRGPRLVTPA